MSGVCNRPRVLSAQPGFAANTYDQNCEAKENTERYRSSTYYLALLVTLTMEHRHSTIRRHVDPG